MTLSRDIPLVLNQSALLFVDVQNFCAERTGGMVTSGAGSNANRDYDWYFHELETRIVPNMQRLQSAFRTAGVEVLYTTIESLTKDGRDRSLDYKISGFNVPKASWDGQVIDALKPAEDEIRFPKSSSSVFISTHIDYVLRNLGVKQLVISGLLTDQCVESAIRDACDLGYLVTQVTDACTSMTADRHESSLDKIKGYCRQATTDQLLSELTISGA